MEGYVCLWDIPYAQPSQIAVYEAMAPHSVVYDDLELTAGHSLIIDGRMVQGGGAPVLASVRAGTLSVTDDDVGLRVQATLDPADPAAASALSQLRRGDVTGLSIGMFVDGEQLDSTGTVRIITAAEGFQASLVARAANPMAEATLRELRERQVAAREVTPPPACPACNKFQSADADPSTCEHCGASMQPEPDPPKEAREKQKKKKKVKSVVVREKGGTDMPEELLGVKNNLLANLRAKREDLAVRAEAILSLGTDEKGEVRELAVEDQKALKRQQKDLAILDERIKDLQDAEVRAAAARRVAAKLGGFDETSGVALVSEALTYSKGGRHSYYRDLILTQLGMGDPQAMERQRRHGAEMRDLSRTDGSGGYFVPPAWLVDEYAPFVRAGRVTANLCKAQELPPGTDSINIPRITGGTSATYSSDNGTVSTTDITDSFVTAAVTTISGQEKMAIQLIDQSPIPFDEMIAMELAAAYAQQVDIGVIGGSGTAPAITGILSTVPVGNQVTWTTGSPTAAGLYTACADAIQRIHTTRFASPNAIVMHPVRWAWIVGQFDSTGRPLVVPNGPAFNPLATQNGVMPEGNVGTMLGLPVYVDANIPVNQGVGTNQDVVLVGRFSDAMLFESSLRTRVLPQPLATTLEVLVQVYSYVAFTAGRYPQSFASIEGTGLVAPSFE